MEPAAPTATSTILIHGLPVSVLCDTGATHSFISDVCVKCLSFVMSEEMLFSIGLPDSSRVIGTHAMLLSHLCGDMYVTCRSVSPASRA